jgi:hypothetical protein
MARERIRLDGGGYGREHLRALAQRIEVADKEVRIMGSKSELLRTLVAASGGKSAAIGVQPSVLEWRPLAHCVGSVALSFSKLAALAVRLHLN